MDFLDRVNTLLNRDEMFCVATVITSPQAAVPPGSKTIVFRNGSMEGDLAQSRWADPVSKWAMQAIKERKKKLVDLDAGMRVFFDVLSRDVKLVVCGAGHIAIPLARFARDAGFSVTVLDDRPDFAHPSRFPDCEVIAEDFVPALRRMAFDAFTYVVVITRGHEHDAECLVEILPHETAYVGLIGSRRRVRFVLEMLARQGCAPERLEALFTPIGIPIGAESPEEIAISIIAELVCVRKKGPAQAHLLRKAVGVDL